jgi:hypothetical protein
MDGEYSEKLDGTKVGGASLKRRERNDRRFCPQIIYRWSHRSQATEGRQVVWGGWLGGILPGHAISTIANTIISRPVVRQAFSNHQNPDPRFNRSNATAIFMPPIIAPGVLRELPAIRRRPVTGPLPVPKPDTQSESARIAGPAPARPMRLLRESPPLKYAAGAGR